MAAETTLSNSDNAVEVRDLRRVFTPAVGLFKRTRKEIVAVEGVSFDIKRGELFGLLGPNGAGKTTTVKMLTTLLIPTSGRGTVLGYDVETQAHQLRSRIGFIFGGERGLYWRLSAMDNLRYFASLYHVEPSIAKRRIAYLLEMVGLEGRGNEKVEGFSRGMKQRLHIARMLLHNPDLLFLDEPTIGLDPVGARDLRQVVRNLQAEKKTILLTTHYMFEADELCERIAVINHGRIIALDTPSGLKQNVSDLSVIELDVPGIDNDRLKALRSLPFVASLAVTDQEQMQRLSIHSPRGAEAVPGLLAALDGVKVGRVVVREPTLEDAYIRLVDAEAKAGMNTPVEAEVHEEYEAVIS